jgi:hypothetical protein
MTDSVSVLDDLPQDFTGREWSFQCLWDQIKIPVFHCFKAVDFHRLEHRVTCIRWTGASPMAVLVLGAIL